MILGEVASLPTTRLPSPFVTWSSRRVFSQENDFALAQSGNGCFPKAVSIASIRTLKDPLKKTCLISGVERGDLPAIDAIAWHKPGIDPSANHLFPSIGWSIGFYNQTSRIECTKDLFTISCYPPFYIPENELIGRDTLHTVSFNWY